MPEPRNTRARRKAKAGLVAVRIGARVYWVPTETARRIERMCQENHDADPQRP